MQHPKQRPVLQAVRDKRPFEQLSGVEARAGTICSCQLALLLAVACFALAIVQLCVQRIRCAACVLRVSATKPVCVHVCNQTCVCLRRLFGAQLQLAWYGSLFLPLVGAV